jgi:pSer/pThr/pTyr-binding forkhead associated (FHA) protein
MSYQNSDPAPDSGLPASSGFSSQSHMGLAEVIQMCCLSRRSGQITFRSGESYGFVYIQHGRVLHAMCGVNEGEEAVYLMLSWPGGSFLLNEDILPHKRTVNLSWEQLLLEGARRADFGMSGPKQPMGPPVTTPEPVTSMRAKESQPKLTLIEPDKSPTIFELEEEYTHVGRGTGNEISLPYPSISNRHCIFILSGSDIVVRDLNSSNGTFVNGEAIAEAVLRPGDMIQMGVVQMKFEPGMKRPKLTNLTNPLPLSRSENPVQHAQTTSQTYARGTTKLPMRPNGSPQADPAKNDSVYVKGQSAINYEDLAKPEVVKEKPWLKIIGGVLLLLVIVAGAYYYICIRH